MQWDPPDWTTASPSDRGFCKPPGRSWGSPGRGEESVSNSEIQRWNGARPAMVTGALAISVSCLSPTYSWGRREIYRSSFALHTRFAECCACGVHKDFRRIFLIERAPPNSPRELHARARTALLHSTEQKRSVRKFWSTSEHSPARQKDFWLSLFSWWGLAAHFAPVCGGRF